MNPTSYATAMLICGIALFIFSLGLIVALARKGKSYGAAISLIPIAVIMIGFPAIKSATIGKDGIQFDEKIADDFAKNPGKAEAKVNFDRELAAVENSHKTNPTKELTPETRVALQTVAQSLAGEKNLSAESRVTLARTQLLLGQAKDATANVRTIMTTHPQLITANPSLHMLVRATPISPNP